MDKLTLDIECIMLQSRITMHYFSLFIRWAIEMLGKAPHSPIISVPSSSSMDSPSYQILNGYVVSLSSRYIQGVSNLNSNWYPLPIELSRFSGHESF